MNDEVKGAFENVCNSVTASFDDVDGAVKDLRVIGKALGATDEDLDTPYPDGFGLKLEEEEENEEGDTEEDDEDEDEDDAAE